MAVKRLFNGYVVESGYRDDWDSGLMPEAVFDDIEAAKAWGKRNVDGSESYVFVSVRTVPVFMTVKDATDD